LLRSLWPSRWQGAAAGPLTRWDTGQGTLRAFNQGEWGGHVEWCRAGFFMCWDLPPSLTGKDSHGYRFEPKDENVVGFARLAPDQVVVIGGLWHLALTKGWLGIIKGAPPEWTVTYVELQGVPLKWCRDGETLVVLTGDAAGASALAHLRPGGAVTVDPVPGAESTTVAMKDFIGARMATRRALDGMDVRYQSCVKGPDAEAF